MAEQKSSHSTNCSMENTLIDVSPGRNHYGSSSDIQNYFKDDIASPLPIKPKAPVTIENNFRSSMILSEDSFGSGSHATVMRGLLGDKRCAIKVVHKRKDINLSSLRREVAISKELDHPSIVKYYHTVEDHTSLYVCMETLEGGELFTRIKEGGAMPVYEVAKVMRQALSAVNYLHHHFIVHRDIKPENFVYVYPNDGRLKLIDFGHSSRYGHGRPLRGICGSPSYMAPEVLSGRIYNEKCDIWSLGMTMYACLTAVVVKDQDNRLGVVTKLKESFHIGIGTEPDKITISTTCWDFLCKLLTDDFENRPSARAMMQHPFLCSYTPTPMLLARTLLSNKRYKSDSSFCDGSIEDFQSSEQLEWVTNRVESVENTISTISPEIYDPTRRKHADDTLTIVERIKRNTLAVKILLESRLFPGWQNYSNLTPLKRAFRYYMAQHILQMYPTDEHYKEYCAREWCTFFTSIDLHEGGFVTKTALHNMIETIFEVSEYIDHLDRDDDEDSIGTVLSSHFPTQSDSDDSMRSLQIYRPTSLFHDKTHINEVRTPNCEPLLPESTPRICETLGFNSLEQLSEKFFKYMDLAGNGVINEIEFYTSVFSNDPLTNNKLVTDVYNSLKGSGNELTQTTLRRWLGWESGVTFYPRIVKNKQNEGVSAICGTDEARVDALFEDLGNENGVITLADFQIFMAGCCIYPEGEELPIKITEV